mgnify:CR=1 FL=1
MSSAGIRQELCIYARKIVEQGLVVGPGGNLSARSGGCMYLSPSGFAVEEILPEQWVEVDIASGTVTEGGLRPSSEVLMHLYAYRRNAELGAMIHTHPTACIAFTLVEQTLPIMFPDQAALVGRTATIPYILPTPALLAETVADQLASHSTILLGNHGLVAVGRNLREAYYRTQIVEQSCRIYMEARSVGIPAALTDAQLEEIRSLESETYRIRLLQQMQ